MVAVKGSGISFLRLTGQIQFGPSSSMGSVRGVLLYFIQYVCFLILGWFIGVNTASFFENHLMANWGPLEAALPSYNWLLNGFTTIVSSILVSYLFSNFSKLKPARPSKRE